MDDNRTHAPSDDVALDRLRAADPAANAEPDMAALRRAVDERRAAGSDVPDELTRRRARWTSWPARAAGIAAAALLVGGGGGYVIGASGDAVTYEAGSAADVISLGGGDAGAGGAEMGRDDGATAMSADMAVWPGMWGRTVFTGSGLSDAAGSGRAWALDPEQSFNEETVRRAAEALGVEGEPRFDDGMWSVGSANWTGPSVQLFPDGSAGLSYHDPTKDVWWCPPPVDDPELLREMQEDPQAGMELSVEEPCSEQDLGAAPTGEAAVREVVDVLAALGLDPADFEVVAEEYGDAAWSYVTAYRVVDGQRTEVTWNATFSGAGLQSLYGATAPLIDLGEYDVVSPAAAVARLSDPRFGASWSGPIAMEGGDVALYDDAHEEASLPAALSPGSRIGWPIDEVTIVDARLGVALHTNPDGAALLVPTYELVSDTGGVWTVIAVSDAALDFSPMR